MKREPLAAAAALAAAVVLSGCAARAVTTVLPPVVVTTTAPAAAASSSLDPLDAALACETVNDLVSDGRTEKSAIVIAASALSASQAQVRQAVAAGCAAATTAPAVAASTPPAARQTLTYVVTGSPATVTYGPEGSDLAGTVPMRVTVPLGTALYYALTAQLQGGGSVTAEILVDGKAVSTGKAAGGYNIAMAEVVKDPLSGGYESAG